MRKTGYFPRPPTSTQAPEILRAESCPRSSHIFQFHENRSRGLGAVGVENRHLPLTRPMAYTTACTTAQAVISFDYQTDAVIIYDGDSDPPIYNAQTIYCAQKTTNYQTSTVCQLTSICKLSENKISIRSFGDWLIYSPQADKAYKTLLKTIQHHTQFQHIYHEGSAFLADLTKLVFDCTLTVTVQHAHKMTTQLMYTPSSFTHSKRSMSSSAKGRMSRLTLERLRTISVVFPEFYFNLFALDHLMTCSSSSTIVHHSVVEQATYVMSSAYTCTKRWFFQELSNQPHIGLKRMSLDQCLTSLKKHRLVVEVESLASSWKKMTTRRRAGVGVVVDKN